MRQTFWFMSFYGIELAARCFFLVFFLIYIRSAFTFKRECDIIRKRREVEKNGNR
nr:MAG TPA: hypothetical protein [Caudoviricetes sp.]